MATEESARSTNMIDGTEVTAVVSRGDNTAGDDAEVGAGAGLSKALGGGENAGVPTVVDPGPGPGAGGGSDGATTSCKSFSPTVSV